MPLRQHLWYPPSDKPNRFTVHGPRDLKVGGVLTTNTGQITMMLPVNRARPPGHHGHKLRAAGAATSMQWSLGTEAGHSLTALWRTEPQSSQRHHPESHGAEDGDTATSSGSCGRQHSASADDGEYDTRWTTTQSHHQMPPHFPRPEAAIVGCHVLDQVHLTPEGVKSTATAAAAGDLGR